MPLRKHLNNLIASLILSMLVFVLLLPMMPSNAAPSALPSCGHSSISKSNAVSSGPPDLAVSSDAAKTNTAVVWAESENSGASGVGEVFIAFSDVMTQSHAWSKMRIDAAINNSEPSIVFDPVMNNVVHIAYQTGTAAGASRIKYAKCTLGGDCSIPPKFIHNNKASVVRSVPQIAVNSNGDPIIIYQESNAGATPPSWVNYAYIQNKGSGAILDRHGTNAVGLVADPEKDPAIAAAGNTLHFVYAVDNGPNNVADRIKYVQLNIATAEFDGTALTVSNQEVFAPTTTQADDPEFPSIAAIGNSVSLVWDMQNISNANQFYLAFNQSTDGGVTWFNDSGIDYRYLPSNNTPIQGPNNSFDARPSTLTTGNNNRLRPNVAKNSSVQTHVAWHEQVGSRYDIMYSFYNNVSWKGTPILTLTVPISFTNVTTVYGTSEFLAEGKGNLNNVRPSIFFGKPGNRLQVAYLHDLVAGSITTWDVYYNGWQLGDAADPVVTNKVKDADCDIIADTVELLPVGGENCPEGGGYTYDSDNDDDFDYAFNCNINQDSVPDFMDEDADGDNAGDFNEVTLDVPGGNAWRDPTVVLGGGGGLFLPVLVKSS